MRGRRNRGETTNRRGGSVESYSNEDSMAAALSLSESLSHRGRSARYGLLRRRELSIRLVVDNRPPAEFLERQIDDALDEHLVGQHVCDRRLTPARSETICRMRTPGQLVREHPSDDVHGRRDFLVWRGENPPLNVRERLDRGPARRAERPRACVNELATARRRAHATARVDNGHRVDMPGLSSSRSGGRGGSSKSPAVRRASRRAGRLKASPLAGSSGSTRRPIPSPFEPTAIIRTLGDGLLARCAPRRVFAEPLGDHDRDSS